MACVTVINLPADPTLLGQLRVLAPHVADAGGPTPPGGPCIDLGPGVMWLSVGALECVGTVNGRASTLAAALVSGWVGTVCGDAVLTGPTDADGHPSDVTALMIAACAQYLTRPTAGRDPR